MRFFKSKEERLMERRVKINQALNMIKAQIKRLKRDEQEFIADARAALRDNLIPQYKMAFVALKRTEQKSTILKQVYLNFKIALREEEQMGAYNKFSEGMLNLSRSVEQLFNSAKLEKVQVEFAQALERAKSMEERIRVIIDSSSEAITAGLDVGDAEVPIADEDIEKLIKGEAVREEEGQFDAEIEEGLKEIEKLKGKG